MADLFAQAASNDAATGVWWKAEIPLFSPRITTNSITFIANSQEETRVVTPVPNSITTSTASVENYIGRLRSQSNGRGNMYVTSSPTSQSSSGEFTEAVEDVLRVCVRVTTATNNVYELAFTLGTDRRNAYSRMEIVAYRGFAVSSAGTLPTNAEIAAAFVALGRDTINAGDVAEILLVDSSNPAVDIATFSYTNPLLVGVQQGILNAVLFKAASSVLVTNYDQDVTFDGETYVADRSLLAVDGPSSGGDFPRYSFDIACREGSPQHTLFAPGSGPEPASILLVTSVFDDITGALTWAVTWSFVGILGEGAMVEGAYSGIIQHPFEYRLHALTKKYWSARALRSANASDAGGDHVATISRDLLSAWRGSQMEPAK